MNQQRAYLYIRVSTDEQADKGYSQRNQDEQLRKYCEHHNIAIAGVYWEDYSGKTFDRPEFNVFLQHIKKNRNSAELLLFLKWDRFSRNVAESYATIHQLRKLGIEPQAIEQPLDMSIPESKIMLAFYLAAPEVENDRRSLNTIAGMRRAMKDGRYCTMAPKGYKNTRNEANRPIIIPGKDAPLVKWLFEEVATGRSPIKEVWRVARRKGLDVSKSNIWYLLRNPIYCGKIFIPAYKDEKAMTIQGLHEPIITEELFNEVQDSLDGKKRKVLVRFTAKEQLPLRGFLECPRCGRKLTGSGTKGNGGIYYYYHCQFGCKERIRAEEANERFVYRLGGAIPKEQYLHLFERIAQHTFQNNTRSQANTCKAIDLEIEKLRQRIANAQELMTDRQISPSEYNDIKARYEPQIALLERQKINQTQVDATLVQYVRETADLLCNLPRYYQTASLPVKQKLIGSICVRKLIFENKDYRTMEFNDVIQGICRLGVHFDGQKKGLASISESQSEEVTPAGSRLILQVAQNQRTRKPIYGWATTWAPIEINPI